MSCNEHDLQLIKQKKQVYLVQQYTTMQDYNIQFVEKSSDRQNANQR